VARFGAMVAPFIPLLNVYMESLPLLIFGTSAFIGGLITFLLPETFGNRLPDTIEEAENIGRRRTKINF
jgi:OCT family organic cation transporter-like MFS transporter 4/5